jgi:hypothetical protein
MSHHELPSLDQTLQTLADLEKRYSEAERIAQTKVAIEANARFGSDRKTIETYLAHLGSKDMFTPIYGLGNTPNGLPVCLPPYLMDLMEATARVLYAVSRKLVGQGGPQYLLDRVAKGWLTEEMADKLFKYFMTSEPDMAFDVLVYGVGTNRGTTFEEFRKQGGMLHAKLLEAQSVDTYFGWLKEFIIGARKAGVGDGWRFHRLTTADGKPCSDAAWSDQIVSTLNFGLENEPESIAFLEIDPEKQPSAQNLVFMADAMCRGDDAHRPVIVDPRRYAIRDGKLFVTQPGKEREIKKVISRIVDVDLHAFIKAREAEGDTASVELFRSMYGLAHVWPDLSKHLAGFYLIDKSSLTEMTLLGSVSIAPKTEIISETHLAAYRKDPELLKGLAIKPLHGMSAKGVFVRPTLDQCEEACAHEKMLAQEIIWATPILPSVMPEIDDRDVQAGICSETRLVMHAGTNAVAHDPHQARMIGGLSRCHFQSLDPDRKIKNDPRNRGWYSNMGAILAVKAEFGIQNRDDAGIGMSPIYWKA